MAKLEVVVESGDPLDVRRFDVSEHVSGLFTVGLWVRSENPSIDFEQIVGKPAGFRLESEDPNAPLGGVRHWTGMVSFMELVHGSLDPAKELSTYHLTIVPLAWVMTQRTNYRIHQDANIPTIVDGILRSWRIVPVWNIDHAAYPVLEYRTQYGETDWDFVSRLLEEAGIAFTFPEAPGDLVFTFADLLHAGPTRDETPIQFRDHPNPAVKEEYITRVAIAEETRPGAYTIRDHDLRRPALPLFGQAPTAPAPEDKLEQYLYRPKAFVIATAEGGDTPMADDRGAYRHDADEGKARATRALAATRVGRCAISFELGSVDMWPGVVFSLKDHPEIKETTRLLCTAISTRGAPGERWTTTGHAVLAATQYRPPLRTPKPRAPAVESATVVGPPNTEILVDELGRARMQFPWDRDGKKDDKSSCWIRVSQGWAGAGFGFTMHPRVGQEVLVSFLDGDPDAPVIVGRVHNRTHPVPYKLPEKQTRSTERSDSSVGSTGDNEILFEDAAGKEIFYVQAQKNMRVLVKNDETITDVRDRAKFVQASETETTTHDRTEVTNLHRVEQVGGTRTTVAEKDRRKLVHEDEFERTEEAHLTYVGKNEHVVVKGTRRELVTLDAHVEVDGTRALGVGGYSLAVGGDHQIKVKKYLVETGDDAHWKTNTDFKGQAPSITVKGPGGFLCIDASGVTIQGTLVKINAGGSPGSGAPASPSLPELPKEALVKVPDKPTPADATLNDAETPPGPAPTVLVSIKNENGVKGGCPLVPKGKTHKYSAVGSPDGGAYKWKVKGHLSIVGDDGHPVVEVRGAATSGAMEDSELSVTYTLPQGTATDSMKITVFEITKIEAAIRSTPCLRGKGRAHANGPKSSTKDSKAFDASTPSVVRGSGDIELTATVKPADVPITWDVERAADDAPGLPGPPTHLTDGVPHKHRLRTDATGSFHVHAFVDCDGDGKRGPDEAGLVLNLHMVSIEALPGAANNFQKRKGNFSNARSTAAQLIVDSGTPVWALAAHNAHYNDTAFAPHAQAGKLGVKLLGGGADQRRGLGNIGMGFLQVASGDTFKGTYADGRIVKEVIVTNAADPFVIKTGTPASANLRFPIRDTRGAVVSGVGVCIISSSDNDKSNLPDGGQKRVVRMIDSPAVILPMTHPDTGSTLASISGYNAFNIFVVGWSSDFDETFTAVAAASWKAIFGTYTAAGGWTNAGARITGDKALRVFHPPQRGEDTPGLERCTPNFVDNQKLDAR
jgi:type VI secretion system secreted protein VgrG